MHAEHPLPHAAILREMPADTTVAGLHRITVDASNRDRESLDGARSSSGATFIRVVRIELIMISPQAHVSACNPVLELEKGKAPAIGAFLVLAHYDESTPQCVKSERLLRSDTGSVVEMMGFEPTTPTLRT